MWNILGDGPLTSGQPISLSQMLEDEGVLAWQEQALCAQTDPGGIFSREGRLHS